MKRRLGVSQVEGSLPDIRTVADGITDLFSKQSLFAIKFDAAIMKGSVYTDSLKYGKSVHRAVVVVENIVEADMSFIVEVCVV